MQEFSYYSKAKILKFKNLKNQPKAPIKTKKLPC
jgi:hypothetical protein